MRPLRTLATVLEMIKIEHTLFALPFAFLARDAGREMSGHRAAAPDPVTSMRDRG